MMSICIGKRSYVMKLDIKFEYLSTDSNLDINLQAKASKFVVNTYNPLRASRRDFEAGL
jgi:hypothetical protein